MQQVLKTVHPFGQTEERRPLRKWMKNELRFGDSEAAKLEITYLRYSKRFKVRKIAKIVWRVSISEQKVFLNR